MMSVSNVSQMSVTSVNRWPVCILALSVSSVSVSKPTPAEKLNDFNGCQVSAVSPLRGPWRR